MVEILGNEILFVSLNLPYLIYCFERGIRRGTATFESDF